MLGKATPSDTARKMHDRCKELMRELDVAEAQLSESVARLNEIRKELQEDLLNSINRLEGIELDRVKFMKEGLLRLCQSGQGMLDHIEQLVYDLCPRSTENTHQPDEQSGHLRLDPSTESHLEWENHAVSQTELAKWKDLLSFPEYVDTDEVRDKESILSMSMSMSSLFSVGGQQPLSNTAAVQKLAMTFVKVDQMRLSLDALKESTQVTTYVNTTVML